MFVLAVLWYFTSYTLIILLWDVNGACYGFCSLVPVRMPEVYFWPAKPKKSLNFSKYILVFDLVLQCFSNMNYWNCMQLFFHFFVLIDIVASVVGTIFFWLCFTFWIEIFSCCFLRKHLQLVPKSALITNGLNLGVFLELWLFSLILDLTRPRWSKMLKLMSRMTSSFFDN